MKIFHITTGNEIKKALLSCLVTGLYFGTAVAVTPQNSDDKSTYVKVCTSEGDFTLRLYDDTPLHRDNFIRLCEDGTYEGVLFHRVIKDFLIQGGDPQSKEKIPGKGYGDGDGGYCIYSEILPEHFCKRGALIDAKLGDDVNPTRMSAGTQFCVVQGRTFTDKELDATEERLNDWHRNHLYHLARYELMLEDPSLSKIENGNLLNAKAWERAEKQYHEQGRITIPEDRREVYRTIGGTPHLDGSVSIYGEIVEGQDIIEKITLMDTDSLDRPLTDVIVLSTKVFRPEINPSPISVVTPDGAWCWFADPRALHHKNEKLGIDKTYIGSIDNMGNIIAQEFDFNTDSQETVLIRSYFQPDDHDNPTFIALPDGRVIVFYSRHTDEPCFYYRITDNSGSLATLGEEKILKTENNTTYPSPFLLSDDPDHLYLCWRGINWHPTIARLSMPDENGDMAFDMGPKQIVQSTGARPYCKYVSNGKDKIFLAYTTGHPDNELPNHLYFNSIDINSGNLSDITGKKLGNVWQDSPFKINKSQEFVSAYQDMVIDSPDDLRDWVWQATLDKDGNPVIAMVTISPDKTEHKYYIARYNQDGWSKTFIADGGKWFHQSPDIEHCYSGGMAIDPENVNKVYCSVPVEGNYGKVYEIVGYTLDSMGNVISTDTITRNSPKNNIRPYVIPESQGTSLRLAWMYGNYYDWIVSGQRPLGFDTAILAEFEGIPESKHSYPLNKNWNLTNNTNQCQWIETVTPADFVNGNVIIDLGDVVYEIDAKTYFPTIRYKGKEWKGNNRIASAQAWQTAERSTNGKWYTPIPYDEAVITLTYSDGIIKTYINNMLDQTIKL